MEHLYSEHCQKHSSIFCCSRFTKFTKVIFRFYQNNEANLECPIASAKPNLDVEKVSSITILGTLVLMLPVLPVPGSVVHPGVPVPPPDEDGGPQLPHVQVRRRRMLQRMLILSCSGSTRTPPTPPSWATSPSDSPPCRSSR